MANIAILGHGVVGSGVAQILLNNSEKFKKQAGQELNLKYILDLRDFSSLPYGNHFTADFNDILNDGSIDVVAELIGGIHPSFDFCMAALNKGISVVTSNKEMVAVKGDELFKAAKDNNCNFLFEASVGGGIPIIRPLNTCLAANNIKEITGILNGTTNYILTKMDKEGASFDVALKEAQDLGYAERNPAADIEGIDSCRKICILADIMMGQKVEPDAVSVSGITELTPEHTEAAKVYGGSVKLIGQAKRADDKAFVCVRPFVVSKENPLSHIEDVFNGVLVEGDSIDKVTFIGRGAGKLPTASAVVADIIDCVKADGMKYNVMWEKSENNILADQDGLKRNWLVKILSGIIPNGIVEERFDNGICETIEMTETELYDKLRDIQISLALPILK